MDAVAKLTLQTIAEDIEQGKATFAQAQYGIGIMLRVSDINRAEWELTHRCKTTKALLKALKELAASEEWIEFTKSDGSALLVKIESAD